MQKSLQNLQDASDDLMMLDDDALLIPYQIGEVFVSHTQEETQEMLEAAKVRYFFKTIIRISFLLFSWFLRSKNPITDFYMKGCQIPS